MKEKLFRHMMFVAFVGCLLMTGCEKEQPVRHLHLNAENLASTGKGYVDQLDFGFTTGDQVNINGTEYPIDESGNIDAEVSGDMIVLYPIGIAPASVTGSETTVSVTVPSSYTYSTNANGTQKLELPMVGKAPDGASTISMKHVCSAMQVTVTNNLSETLTLESVTLEGAGIGGTVTVNSETGIASAAGSGSSVKLLFPDVYPGTTIAANSSLTVQVPVLPVAQNTGVTIKVVGHTVTDIYKFSRSTSIAMNRATVHRAPVTMTTSSGYVIKRPIGAICGLFSVSSTKQVWFSRGNLQYNNNGTHAWRFAWNQWDYCQQSAGTWETGSWVDLFGWGTWTGSSPNPMNTSTSNNDYSWDNSDFSMDLDNGCGTWRTLTKNEWTWLISPTYQPNPGTNCRTSSTVCGVDNARYAFATVNGKAGLIIFPDIYTHPSGVTPLQNINQTFTYPNHYIVLDVFNYNIYSGDAWAKMEEAGCVFLPVAGERLNGTEVHFGYTDYLNVYHPYSNYWSSSASDYDGQSSCFTLSYTFGPYGNGNSYYGYSVRLVQDKSN